ncbi:MAG: WbqC-like family protein [Bacteroidetes bacterium]|nr:WbqC-like family protein [Bacteroidota bacterium]
MEEKFAGTDFLRMQADNNFAVSNDNLPDFRETGKRTVLLSTAYLPPVSFFTAMCRADDVLLEGCENYLKQTYRNRCRIATANGVEILSIPVESESGTKSNIRDVRISSHGNWQQIHWRAITSAYMNSPFFEYYQDDFRIFFENKYTFLWDYNLELLTLIINLLDISPKIKLTEKFEVKYSTAVDMRDTIHPKKTPVFITKPYYQVFENKFGFRQDLSIIDLLFNMGNESIVIISQLAPNPLKGEYVMKNQWS